MKTLSTTPAEAAAAAAAAASAAAKKNETVKHKRRYCRAEGCDRIVKSQGLCQRHGARPKICLVPGCTKQAQGNFDGMCKSHFKANKRATTPLPPKPDPSAVRLQQLPPPTGPSVYDRVIPESLSWTADMGTVMPLVQHLKDGFVAVKPPAWHRNEERAARGLFPIHNSATQLEGWERELVWMEILLLTGNPSSSFRHLARGWGRDKGFHMVLAQYICERHGDVQRKKRDNLPNGGNATTTTGPNGTMTGTTRRRKSGETASNGNGSNINISANVWDDACYGDAAYNEALAADLLDFSPGQARASAGSGNGDHSTHPQDHAGTNNGQREYSFELPMPIPAVTTTTNPTTGPREFSFELLGNGNGTSTTATTTTTGTGTSTTSTTTAPATMATSHHDTGAHTVVTGRHMSADEAAGLIQQQFQHLVHYPAIMSTPNYGTGTYHQDVNDSGVVNNGMSKSVLEEFAEYTLLNSDQHRNESS